MLLLRKQGEQYEFNRNPLMKIGKYSMHSFYLF